MKKKINITVSLVLALLMLFATPVFAASQDESNKERIVTAQDLYTVQINESAAIQAALENPSATNYTLKYTSLAPNIATVDGLGTITGKNSGTTKITITSTTGVSKEVFVTVKPIPVTGIDSLASRTTLYVGETAKITNTFTPSNSTRQFVKYETTNPGVVSVDANGNVLAAGYGTATITISVADDESIFARIDFVVNRVPYFGVSIPEEMLINETAALEVTTKYELAYTISHVSSNPDVVTISDSEDGTTILTAVGEGKAEICTTIILADGYEITQIKEIKIDDPETEYRCSMCDAYDASIGTSTETIFMIFHAIIHFFSELLAG